MTKTAIFNSHSSFLAIKNKNKKLSNEQHVTNQLNNNINSTNNADTKNTTDTTNTTQYVRPTYNSVKTIINNIRTDDDDFITKISLKDNKSFTLNIGDKLNGITYTKGKIYEIGYAYGFLDTPKNFNDETDKIKIISNGHGPHEYDLDKSFKYPFRTFSVKKLRNRKFFATDKFKWEFSTPDTENILFICIKESEI